MQISAMPKRKEVENLKKFKRFYQRILMLITAAAVLCSALPVQLAVSAAGVTVKRTVTYYEEYRRQSELKIGPDAVLHFADWAVITDSDTNEPLYCIEPGADLNSAVDKLSYSEGTWAALTGSKLELLGRVFLYSYTKGNPNASAASRQQYIATQMLVWEVMAGQQNKQWLYSGKRPFQKRKYV